MMGQMPKSYSMYAYNDSTGCDEVDDYFATEADTMIGIVCEVDVIKASSFFSYCDVVTRSRRTRHI